MVEFMKAGGWSMWFVLLLGLGSLAAAIWFLVRRQLGTLALVRALTLATLFAIASGLCANVAAVMTYASRNELAGPHLVYAVTAGLAEAAAPGILGFAMLAISWLLVAVGTRRAQDRIE
jgi:hypothetical protein